MNQAVLCCQPNSTFNAWSWDCAVGVGGLRILLLGVPSAIDAKWGLLLFQREEIECFSFYSECVPEVCMYPVYSSTLAISMIVIGRCDLKLGLVRSGDLILAGCLKFLPFRHAS